jgi:hypothetical protein
MRTRIVALALFASIGIPAPASAAAPPGNVLLAGTITRAYLATGADSWCLFEGTNSTYMNKTSPAAKLISLPDIIIAPGGSVGPTAAMVGGQARLTFSPTNSAAGEIAFVPAVQATFNRYKESYDAVNNILTVSFTIHFPSCTLPVSATYRN